jgi:maleylacetate reductase
MREDDIARIADLVAAASFVNPRPATRDDIAELLRKAWAGVSP